MDLSVIIVSYNVSPYLKRCLESLVKASEGISSETIVIDNNSSDDSCEMVRSNFPGVKLIVNEKNIGFSAACNQGIKVSAGDFILLLNPDTLPEEASLVKCVGFMQSHVEAGALGARLENGRGKFLPESKRALPTPRAAFFRLSGISTLFPHSGYLNRYYLGDLDEMETNVVEVLTGAFMMIRRKVIETTGLLDEDYFMYGEDIDLSMRIMKSGFKNYYFPEVTIVHFKGKSTAGRSLVSIIHFYRAMLIFLGKHFRSEYKPYIFPIRIAIYIAAALSLLRRMITIPFTVFFSPGRKENR